MRRRSEVAGGSDPLAKVVLLSSWPFYARLGLRSAAERGVTRVTVGISGIELLALLRQDPRWHEPPIILMSADARQVAITDALRAGLVTAFLRKPFDVDELVHHIQVAVSDPES